MKNICDSQADYDELCDNLDELVAEHNGAEATIIEMEKEIARLRSIIGNMPISGDGEPLAELARLRAVMESVAELDADNVCYIERLVPDAVLIRKSVVDAIQAAWLAAQEEKGAKP